MYQIDFKKPAHLYFIGIGGISMSGFAELLHTFGFTISGSDACESHITQQLEEKGIHVLYGQDANNITENIDLVIYTAAIPSDNPEYCAALALGIPMLNRAEMIGQVMKNYKSAIAISGTHGKTTTTSIVSHILIAAQMDPTISVGGILKAINGNLRIGKSDNFLTEACEYTNSFLSFFPTTAIILNIDEDHLDFFKDLADIRNSFQLFAKRIPVNGTLIINADIENYKELTNDLDCNIYTYALDDNHADFSATNITFDEAGCGHFDLIYHGEITNHFDLKIVGLHNISNALAAIALSYSLNLSDHKIQEGFSSFCGTNRRFEYKGDLKGVNIIDDYAHHPTEIRATLTAAQKFPHKTLWCVFQPHTYSRTKSFLNEFAQALCLADKVILADIYASREQDPGDISSLDLKIEMELYGKEAYYFSSFDEIENFILENCTNGDLLITMGAGDVVTIGEELLFG